jgi:hypothetical protein
MKPANLVSELPVKLYKKPSKMGNNKCRVDDITFDSQMEARRYIELKRLRELGEVLMWIRQPTFDLGGGTVYRADFLVFWANGLVTVEDVKGHRTDAFIKAKKQVETLYPITIIEKKA